MFYGLAPCGLIGYVPAIGMLPGLWTHFLHIGSMRDGPSSLYSTHWQLDMTDLCLLLLALLGRTVAQWATVPSKTIHTQYHRLVAISLLTYAQVWDNSRAWSICHAPRWIRTRTRTLPVSTNPHVFSFHFSINRYSASLLRTSVTTIPNRLWA